MTDKNETNPYAPPRSRVIPQQPPATVSRVEGDCIVVKSEVRLPMRCIVTNVQCNRSDQKMRKLRYAPSFRLVISHKNCFVYRCMSAKQRKRQYLIRAPFFVAAFILSLIATGSILVAAGIAATILWTVPLDPLKIANHKNGEFWIKGFHNDFLNSLVSEEGWERV